MYEFDKELIMNDLFLLGAGASVEAGIPGAYRMTAEIARLVNDNQEKFHNAREENREMARAFNFVLGGLLYKAGQSNLNPLEAGVNVEDLFSSMRLLGERDESDIAPFVGSWHSHIEKIDRIEQYQVDYEELIERIVNAATRAAVEEIKGQTSSSFSNYAQYGQELEDAINSAAPTPGQGIVFKRTAERMTKLLANLVWKDDPKVVEHLLPLVSLGTVGQPITIATLNYDNTIELAAESLSIPLQLGVDNLTEEGKLRFPPHGVNLLKLHGSVNWTVIRNSGGVDKLPHLKVDVSRDFRPLTGVVPSANNYYEPAVIFGQRNKLTAEGPFLDLLQIFRERLSKTHGLVVIGYSFRDSHINTYIANWLNQSEENILTVIDPKIRSSNEEFVTKLLRLEKSDSKQRVKIIDKEAGAGILDLLSNYRVKTA